MGFPTPKNPGKTEDHTSIQNGILKKLNELKEKEQLNTTENAELGDKFHERFDWTDTLLTEIEKQSVEKNTVECHDKISRHRMDTVTDTVLKMKLTAKDDKAVYSHSPPMPIHPKNNFSLDWA